MNASKISVLILAGVLVMIGVAQTETSPQPRPTPHGGLEQAATPVDAAPQGLSTKQQEDE